jgi:hypothetical protein
MDEPIEEKRKPYRPTRGSAGYSILVSLAFEYEKGNTEGLSKDALCKIGNIWATEAIESNSHGTQRFEYGALADRSKFAQSYSGWDIVSTLIKKHELLKRFKQGIWLYTCMYDNS